MTSGVDSGGAPPGFGSSEEGQSLIFCYQSLAITASTSGFEKLSMALLTDHKVPISILHIFLNQKIIFIGKCKNVYLVKRLCI